MKFTTFHQHQHPYTNPAPANGVNGNNNNIGSNFQTIYVANPQQHFISPPQMQHQHQPQQFFDYNRQLPTSSNYVPKFNSTTSLGGSNQFWNQQQQPHMLRNEFNGNSESG
jgi:hypothetical protein